MNRSASLIATPTCVAMLLLSTGVCQAAPVVLGIGAHEADRHNVEFVKYSRMLPVYQQNGLQASLVDMDGLYLRSATEDKLVELFRQYHVIQLTTTDEGVQKLTPEAEARARIAGAALARYVREGGGLLLQPRSVRYPGDDDQRYWNLVLAPLGCRILHEGNFDPTRQYEGRTLGKATFWFTRAVKPHPVTKDVQCLYLPLHDFGPTPGQPAMEYSPDWQTIVSGEPEARSYRSGLPGDPNTINLESPGTYATAPPVVAVRQLGRGRIVCFPIAPLFTGMNYGNPLWTHTVETKGDPASGRASDCLKLQMNAYRWLAEPAQGNPAFGTYKPEPHKPVEFPPRVDWDQGRFAPLAGVKETADGTLQLRGAAPGVRGIVGAHTSLTDGRGTVADYVAAAKAAGLSILVFAEPLELLSEEKLEKLKADCAAASQSPEFYACPGIEFTDGLGNRWAFWGEKLVYPAATFAGPYTPGKSFTLWDGQRILHYGKFAELCSFPPSALLDYRQLRDHGAHPENLWWFFHYLPLVYDHGRLVADNYADFLFGLRDLRWCAPASFTRVTDPAEVAGAAATLFTSFRDLASAKEALNTRCTSYFAAYRAQQAVSQGPRVLAWEAMNSQMESNWYRTRGAQRVRLRFAVESDAGIREVKVHDADRGPIRRYLGHGAKVLSREFELVHDQQRYLTLEIIDEAGKRAFSNYVLLFCYKQGLFRCGDNLNILGATGMIWHPDRNEMFCMAKQFHNGENYTLEGWDRGGALCPMPSAHYEDLVYIQGVGPYPHPATHHAIPGRQMDVLLSSYNLQIATMQMKYLSQRFDIEERSTPALCTVAQDLGENEYFQRTHTIYAPEDRRDMYLVWNYRRRREGEQNYQGGFIWHEGEIRFKKDVTLTGSVPISLVFFEIPTDLDKPWGNRVVVTDADGVTREEVLRDAAQAVRGSGRLRGGGYAAQLPSLVGQLAFFAPPGSDFCYHYVLPGRLYVGLGRDGQQIKAGTVIPYRFAIGTFATEQAGAEPLEHHLHGLNLAGGTSGYPIRMTAGEVGDATFFLTLRASAGEAMGTLGPQKLIIDLPIRVTGLEDNGCAAVYTSRRPWFRFVPVCDGTAYFQESLDVANDLWVGNILLADHPAVKLTVVVDGQAEGRPPLVEVHNPTDQAIQTTLRSPTHTPVFGGLHQQVNVSAGQSLFLRFDGHSLRP